LLTKPSLKRNISSSINRKSKKNKKVHSEDEELSNNEILKLELEERKMALKERAIKVRTAEAEARKLEAEAEALEIANLQQKKRD